MIKNDLFKSVLNKINSFDIDEECSNIALSVSIIFPSQNVYLKSFMIWKCWIFSFKKYLSTEMRMVDICIVTSFTTISSLGIECASRNMHVIQICLRFVVLFCGHLIKLILWLSHLLRWLWWRRQYFNQTSTHKTSRNKHILIEFWSFISVSFVEIYI